MRNGLRYLMLFGLLALATEGASLLAGRVLERKKVFYTPVRPLAYAEYLAKRDPHLGWPAPSTFGRAPERGIEPLDAAGCRPDPASAAVSAARAYVSLYGDSFTYGSEVDDEQAWGHVLARRLGRRVANYGVGGYGTDQAYLRFVHTPQDGAAVVILGHMTQDIERNVNQLANLLFAGGPDRRVGLKPRFVPAAGGGLRLVPLPTFTEQEYLALGRAPARYLPQEYYLPDTRDGIRTLRFPYSWSLLRVLGDFRIRARFQHRPRYADLYQPQHPSQALAVTTEILVAFCRAAELRGKTPIVVIFPTYEDIEARRQGRPWPYENLVQNLRQRRVPHLIDVGEAMLKVFQTQPERGALFSLQGPHYNAAGNRLVAELVHDHMRQAGLLPADAGGVR